MSWSSPARCGFGVEPQFRGHRGAGVGHFTAVLQEILSVAGTVLHPAHHAHEGVGHVGDAQVDDGALADLEDVLFNLAGGLGHHLLDAGRVDAAVAHQLVKAQAGNLACRDRNGSG